MFLRSRSPRLLALSLEGKESCQNESGETRGEDGRLKQSTKSTICCCLPLSSSQAACNDATVCLDSIHNVADHSRVLSNHACSLLFLLVFRAFTKPDLWPPMKHLSSLRWARANNSTQRYVSTYQSDLGSVPRMNRRRNPRLGPYSSEI